MVRRLAALLLVSVVLAGGGCSSEPPPQAIPTTPERTRASATQSTAPSSGDSSTSLTRPQLPEAAKSRDDAGQKAFLEYWIETYNYALMTGDTEPIMEISDRTSAANEVIDTQLRESHDEGVRVVGMRYQLDDSVRVPLDQQSQTRPTLIVTREAGQEITANGKVTEVPAAVKKPYWALLTYQDDHWRFDGLRNL